MDIWGIIEALVPTIIATTGVVALLKGYVARAYKALVVVHDKAPPWVTRVVALVVGVLFAVVTGDETMLPEITEGSVAAIAAMFLAWLQARIGESGA